MCDDYAPPYINPEKLKQPEDILFWSRHDTYGFFSNFARTPITVRGKTYKTVEHFYQASKCVLEDDFERICSKLAPWEAKYLGGIVNCRADWEEVKEDFMLEGLRAKFTQYPALARLLVSTGTSKLHEDSPSDEYWGYVGGKGKDRLGVLLMQVREELK